MILDDKFIIFLGICIGFRTTLMLMILELFQFSNGLFCLNLFERAFGMFLELGVQNYLQKIDKFSLIKQSEHHKKVQNNPNPIKNQHNPMTMCKLKRLSLKLHAKISIHIFINSQFFNNNFQIKTYHNYNFLSTKPYAIVW